MATTRLGLRYPVLTDTDNVPRDAQNLATDVDGFLGDPAAVALTPATGWRALAGYETPRYRMRAHKTVSLSGAMERSGANVGVIAVGATLVWAAPLPVGVRPLRSEFMNVETTSGPVRLAISATDGSLTLVPILSSITVNTGWFVSVSGVSWDLV